MLSALLKNGPSLRVPLQRSDPRSTLNGVPPNHQGCTPPPSSHQHLVQTPKPEILPRQSRWACWQSSVGHMLLHNQVLATRCFTRALQSRTSRRSKAPLEVPECSGSLALYNLARHIAAKCLVNLCVRVPPCRLLGLEMAEDPLLEGF